MDRNKEKQKRHKARHYRVRRSVKGRPERPRLAIYRSLKHIYAQLINDEPDSGSVTLAAASTRDKEVRESIPYGGNVAAAKAVGAAIARRAKALGIKEVSFDRGGFRYHGRVKALADSARESGLVF